MQFNEIKCQPSSVWFVRSITRNEHFLNVLPKLFTGCNKSVSEFPRGGFQSITCPNLLGAFAQRLFLWDDLTV